MFYDYRVLEITDGQLKKQYAEQILSVLPEWFGNAESLVGYIETVGEHPFFGAFHEGECVGFFAGKIHHERTGEIYVCGIHPDYHRKGLGIKLYLTLEEHFTERCCSYVMVKTLSPLRASRHYEATRRFYEAAGFMDFYTDTQIWDEENPCLIMIKNLV
ncbi:MAG: GNAT family N-acetyltransferase [Turicibacter sp.]|nr:GNAT family N-acetyltransferase [Turicibacter sp.]